MTVTERTREQGRRLRRLRKRLGVPKTRIAGVLGFDTTQAYDLYERGTSVIRLDRISEWAEAFGISEQEFLDEILQPSKSLEQQAADDDRRGLETVEAAHARDHPGERAISEDRADLRRPRTGT